MNPWAAAIDTAFALAWRASWHAAVAIVVVFAARRLAGRGLTPAWRCALWGLVAARLMMPAAPAGRWSLFNLGFASPPVATGTVESPVAPSDGLRVTVG